MTNTLILKGSETLVTKVFSNCCDFCGESKPCIRPVKGIEIDAVRTSYKHVALLDVDRHYKPRFFSDSIYQIPKGDDTWVNIVTGRETKTINPDVCADCAKQIVALLK